MNSLANGKHFENHTSKVTAPSSANGRLIEIDARWVHPQIRAYTLPSRHPDGSCVTRTSLHPSKHHERHA